MNARYYNGDDDRDTLTAEDRCCSWCGALSQEPCAEDCLCDYCVGKRAREAAQRTEVVRRQGAA